MEKYKQMSDSQLYQFCKKHGAISLEARRKFASALPEVVHRKLYKKHSFGSIYEFAAKLAGMTKAAVDSALWVMRKIEDKPELVKIAQEKGFNRVKPIANIATKETEEFWAKKAANMSQNTLRIYARTLQKQKNTADADFCVNTKIQPEKPRKNIKKGRISMDLPVEMIEKIKRIKGEHDWEEFMELLLTAKERESSQTFQTKSEEIKKCNCEPEKPKPVRNNSRYIPKKIRTYVTEKTGHHCAFPGCTKHATSLHHTQRFAAEKVHDPDKLIPLCDAHERMAHLGLIENEEEPPETWCLRAEANFDTPKEKVKRYVDDFVWLYRH
jgi:hypothetical protein